MRLPFLPLALLAVLPLASAQETLFRHVTDTTTDTHVEVTALFSQPSRGGFLPVRVKLSNNLNTPRSARLSFDAKNGYSDRIRCSSAFQFDVPEGKTVTRDILVPLTPAVNMRGYGETVRVEVNMRGGFGSDFGSMESNSPASLPCVLLSQDLYTANSSRLDSEVSSSPSYRHGGNRFAGSFSPSQMPSDWLAYSGYDCLIVSEAEWSAVPPGPRNAIFSWVRLGGRLIVCTRGGTTRAMLRLPEDTGFGTCELFSELKDSGSGTLEIPPKETLKLVENKPPVIPLAVSVDTSYQSGWPLQTLFGGKAFHYGLFISVLVAFSILVGPVNLFVFAKSGRRHRLFITTPAISLGASLLLVGLIIFQDGFGGKGRRLLLMEVRPDAGGNAAYIHQEQISRTGIMTGDKFTVDPAAFVSPVPIAASRWARVTNRHDSTGAFHLQPAGGKLHASGDWWKSRSEHGHLVSAVLPTRGRIETTSSPGTLVSTFQFPISRLFYLDGDGQWHRATNIHTGKSFALEPVDASFVQPELAAEANGFVNRHRRMFERAKDRRGHFIAITDDAPGIDTHPGIRWDHTHTVITGPVTGGN